MTDAQNFTYDTDGNMTTFYTPDGYTATATYDAENRLRTVTYNDGAQHSYAFYYDAYGLLAKQTVDSVETRFVRDGFLCVQERDNSNNVDRAYVWGLNKGGGIEGLLELTEDSAHYSYLYDGKGNVSAMRRHSSLLT